MVLYRRNYVEGGTYFFTATLKDRSSELLVEQIAALRAAYAQAQRKAPFETVAIAVLPEHVHTIWTLPVGDSDYSGRWRIIKSAFSHALARAGLIALRSGQSGYEVWQPRFWEHTIRDEDLRRHVDYIHYNPVKHGLVARVADWPHSSFHRFVERGDLPLDWAGDAFESDDGAFGE